MGFKSSKKFHIDPDKCHFRKNNERRKSEKKKKWKCNYLYFSIKY